MESKELKFLLKLLGCNGYRSLMSAPIFDTFKQDKSKICHGLSDRGLIDYDREISSVSITSAGKNVLKMDMTKLPISPAEYKILQVLVKAGGKVVPRQMKGMKNVKVTERDRLIRNLANSGFVTVGSGMKQQKCEIWVTEAGLNYLINEFTGKGSQAVISLDLLTNYLKLLRKSPSDPDLSRNGKPTDEDVLKAIAKLDKAQRTDNYLPIFHLRQEFASALSRDELDKTLYRLQKAKKIQLSSLGEQQHYTKEQLDSGIPQKVGGSLFFVVLQ